MVCAQGIHAQQQQPPKETDFKDMQKRIAKSDEDIANPKKNTKSTVWMERGKLFLDAYNLPVGLSYPGMSVENAETFLGKPTGQPETKQIGDFTYTLTPYATATTYAREQDGKVVILFWESKMTVVDNPLDKSAEAYMKAYELDNKTEAKVKEAQKMLGNSYKQEANAAFSLLKYIEAADEFTKAYKIMIAKPYMYGDTLSAFNAGYLYTAGKEYKKGIEMLREALKYNYESGGDTYFFLYHCYFGLQDMANAQQVLLDGLAKHPTNTRIVEGLLSVFTSSDSDPGAMIPIVEKAIAADPKNANLYAGLGLVYDKLGDQDKAIDAFAKSVSLESKEFSNNFNLGLLYVKKADDLYNELARKNIPQKEYNTEQAAIFAIYSKAIPPLERALAAQPGHASTVELLKNLTFRLRDTSPEMQAKFDKYEAMFKAQEGK